MTTQLKLQLKIVKYVLLGLLAGAAIGFALDEPGKFLAGLAYAAAVLLTMAIETLILLVLGIATFVKARSERADVRGPEDILDGEIPPEQGITQRERAKAYFIGIIWVILLGGWLFFGGYFLYEEIL